MGSCIAAKATAFARHTKGAGSCSACPQLLKGQCFLQVLLDAFRQRSLISGYGHNNLNTIACNLINLSQDLGGCIHVVVNDFQDAVNEQFGDIIVTSQNTSNKNRTAYQRR